jgi:uncharacterized membrane protein YfhO
MVYRYIVADGQQQALDLLSTYSGQLNNVAIVFKKDVQAMPFTTNAQGTYTIDFIKYSPESITIKCTTSQPGLFFISDTYFPGWHATVDGESTKVLRVDYAFQGLWLTQGSHTIELKYAPSSFKYGALLSVIGILSLIGFYIVVFRKKKGNIPKMTFNSYQKLNPPLSPFSKGGDSLNPSLEKRGRGDFSNDVSNKRL